MNNGSGPVLLILFFLLLSCGQVPRPAPPAPPGPGPVVPTPPGHELPPPGGPSPAVIREKELRELSGLACSLRRPGAFWAHNDSGDPARLFLFDGGGRSLGTVTLAGLAALDWEDCAVAAGPRGEPWIWVGDIGNNLSLPILKVVYRFREPDPGLLPLILDRREIQTFRFRLPAIARDCECLMVQPGTGMPYLVPKANQPEVGLFTTPSPPGPGQGVIDLVKVATLVVPGRPGLRRMVSAGDFLPGGRAFLLRTYGWLHLYRLPPPGGGCPRLKPYHSQLAPSQPAGDAVTVDPRTGTAYLSGEGPDPRLIPVPLPRGGGESPGKDP